MKKLMLNTFESKDKKIGNYHQLAIKRLFTIAVLLLFFIVAHPGNTFADVFVDNDGPGTSSTGTWSVSGATDFYGADSLWARNGATYTWEFEPVSPGMYEQK